MITCKRASVILKADFIPSIQQTKSFFQANCRNSYEQTQTETEPGKRERGKKFPKHHNVLMKLEKRTDGHKQIHIIELNFIFKILR